MGIMNQVDACYKCDPKKFSVKNMTKIKFFGESWRCKCGHEHEVKRKSHQITCPFTMQYADSWFRCDSCGNTRRAKPEEIKALMKNELKPVICRGLLKVSS